MLPRGRRNTEAKQQEEEGKQRVDLDSVVGDFMVKTCFFFLLSFYLFIIIMAHDMFYGCLGLGGLSFLLFSSWNMRRFPATLSNYARNWNGCGVSDQEGVYVIRGSESNMLIGISKF